MPKLTNTQKQENYRKQKKEAEEGSQRPKTIQIVGVTFYVQFAVQSKLETPKTFYISNATEQQIYLY
jgi:hypothetical protein